MAILNSARKQTHHLMDSLSPNTWLRSSQHALHQADTKQLSSDIVSRIADALLADREAHAQWAKLISTCKSADVAICQLDRQINTFAIRLEELNASELPANVEEIETLREAKRMFQATRAKFKAKLQDLEQQLDEVADTIHNGRSDLYAVLDELFVESRVIPKHPKNVASGSITLHATNDDITIQYNGAQKNENSGAQVASRSEERTNRLQRSAGVVNLRPMAADSVGGKATAKPATVHVQDPKVEAERDYKYFKLLVGQAEADFDDRQDVFDQERDQLMLKRAAGDAVESMFQLDKRHILETRKLSQRFAKAEENYYAAKEAAVAAGVDLGPDVESGFASRADDGYSLSMEVDGETFVDRDRIDRWLAMLPECNTITKICDEDFDEIGRTTCGEDDSLDLESVEMCETRSAIADGSWRRRIDKWNSIWLSAAMA